MNIRLFSLATAIIMSVGLVSTTNAGVINFVHTGSGSGSIGETVFENRTFTISATINTANVTGTGSFRQVSHDTAMIEIEGEGTYTFTSGTRHWKNGDLVGFARSYGAGGSDLFNGPSDSSIGSWDMLTSLATVNGTASMMQWTSPTVDTSGGELVFDVDVTDTINSTFTATVATVAVPEPSSIAMFGIGALGLFGYSRRRRQTSAAA